MKDTLSQLFSAMHNASKQGRKFAKVRRSKFGLKVLRLLRDAGYIDGFSVYKSMMVVDLKYFGGEMVLRNITRVSKPGQPIYMNLSELSYYYGIGLGDSVIISTNEGLLYLRESFIRRKGGEVIALINKAE